MNSTLISILEICCTCCYFNNIHSNHKLIQLSDTQSLEKENITIESKMKKFNDISKATEEIKTEIENNIKLINDSFENTIDKLTKSFLKLHEQLIKEENDLKDKLKNEVTKIKEQLEIYISEANNQIKMSERINKGVKKIQNEEANILKNLAYISKINKTQKSMKKLVNKPMKNISISYDEEKRTIKFDEYNFNKILKPANIEIKNISFSHFNVLWKEDNKNIDKKQIKYILEIKKDNEKFHKFYKGNNNYCLVDNLDSNTNYEIRICSVYNNKVSEWTEIQKIKTKELTKISDSIILSESDKYFELSSILKEWTGNKEFQLIYRGSRDGMTHKDYHKKCDNKGKVIILIKSDKGNIFGGFASKSWIIENYKYQDDPDSFLFSLINIYNTKPIKFPVKNSQNALYYRNDFGVLFGESGNDLGLYKDFIKEGGFSCSFPNTFSDSLGKGKSIFTGGTKNYNFLIKEIEVFKIL